MERAILSDERLDRELKRNGFVVVDFLPERGVRELLDFYVQNPGPDGTDFHATHFSKDRNYKRAVHETLVVALGPLLSPMFGDYSPVFGNFMVKEAFSKESMPLHADWTYVDERYERSMAMWIPLVDTTSENGQLGVIPASHRLTHAVRGPRIRQWTEPVNELLIRSAGKVLALKAGQAVIYDHGLLHYSLPNLSESVRPAINLSLTPRNIPLVHYTVPEGQELLFHFEASGPEFFLNYDHFQMPESGRLIDRRPMDIPLLNNKVDRFLKENGKLNPFGYIRWRFSRMQRKVRAQLRGE